MKKFSKLLLLFLAVISSLFFLFYKLKYDRLYYVMQVLEVFGTPSNQTLCTKDVVLVPSKNNEHEEFTPPAPQWRQVGADLHVYSAHCSALASEDGACPQVKILAVQSVGADLSQYLCKLWYEGSVNPIPGTFSLSLEQEGEEHTSAILSCETKYKGKVPYGVTLYKAKEDSKSIIPVPPVLPRTSPSTNLSICILPPAVPADNAPFLIESLIFHTLMGVTRFLVYSSALPHSFLRTVQKLSKELNIKIIPRPWSPPEQLARSLELQLVSLDCYLSNLRASNYILLANTQILMPRRADSLPQVLEQARLEAGPNSVEARRFCSEYPNDKKSSSLPRRISMLQSTYFNKQLGEGSTVDLYHSSSSTGASQTNSSLSELLAVNEYGSCDRYDFSEKDETAVYDDRGHKFSSALVSMFDKYT